jgi:protein SCO1/2
MHKRALLQRIALATIALPALAALGACGKSAPATVFESVDITGADYAKDFQLTDHDGKRRSLADFKGKAVVVFFGFTQCPDVCPTTMARLAEVKQRLGADGDRLQVVFVSVDPERDTPAILKAYMGNFDPGFLALRPTPEELPAVAKSFKIYYKKVEGSAPDSYTMDHSAGDYIYDPQGRLRLYSRQGTSAESMAKDIGALLKAPA